MLCKTHANKIKASQKHTNSADIGVPISVVTQGSMLTNLEFYGLIFSFHNKILNTTSNQLNQITRLHYHSTKF